MLNLFCFIFLPAAACIDIPVEEVNATDWSIEAYLEQKNFTINFDLLLNTVFTFHLRTIKLRVNLPFDTPECYGLTGKVSYEKSCTSKSWYFWGALWLVIVSWCHHKGCHIWFCLSVSLSVWCPVPSQELPSLGCPQLKFKFFCVLVFWILF